VAFISSKKRRKCINMNKVMAVEKKGEEDDDNKTIHTANM
jgi:hypothetical protein